MSFEAPDRLEGSSYEIGGLIIKKKDKESHHEFKKPQHSGSLLGLDQLAREKRKVKEERGDRDEKRYKSVDADLQKRHKNGNVDSDKDGKTHEHRQYRTYHPDTPSNPGGVNVQAREKIYKRREGERDKKGIYAESHRNRYDHKEYRKSRDKRLHEKNKSSSRSYRDSEKYTKSSHRDKSKTPHSEGTKSGYEQWEETPGGSSRRLTDSEYHTPRLHDRGKLNLE